MRAPCSLQRKPSNRPVPILPGHVQIGDITGWKLDDETFQEVRVFAPMAGWNGEKVFVEDLKDESDWHLVDVHELLHPDEYALLKAMKGIPNDEPGRRTEEG